MPRVIHAPLAGKPPAIYAFAPGGGNNVACLGTTWDIRQIVGEGWACFAVRAEDEVGNVGVSAPLRVCVDDVDPPEACDPWLDALPSCTDGCTPPAGLPANDTLQRL